MGGIEVGVGDRPSRGYDPTTLFKINKYGESRGPEQYFRLGPDRTDFVSKHSLCPTTVLFFGFCSLYPIPDPPSVVLLTIVFDHPTLRPVRLCLSFNAGHW